MRILLIMNPGIPVPPEHYGGIERIVFLLANEYQKKGHDITLIAGPGSYCNGRTITFGTNGAKRKWVTRFYETAYMWLYLWKNRNDFDLVHNFGRLIYLIPLLNFPVKKIMSYQRAVTPRGIKIINRLPNRNLIFTGCSDYCTKTGNIAGVWKTVYNAINFDQYELREKIESDAPLMFLGRLDRIKGAHTAIKVARETNHKLTLAGNIPETKDNYDYYKSEIEPQFDEEQIIYIGALNDAEKNNYLGKAKALLFPIEWDEPFGIVMIEAMACGTPVIAFNHGAVSEVIAEENGVKVNTHTEMIAAVHSIDRIDRKTCQNTAFKRFDISKIAADYLNLF